LGGLAVKLSLHTHRSADKYGHASAHGSCKVNQAANLLGADIKLAKIVREKAGIIDMEKATHVEFSRTFYLIRVAVPGFGSIAIHDSHIKYLSKYIRYPDKL
jgi:hypothetical protein